jgi:hypothetical protein
MQGGYLLYSSPNLRNTYIRVIDRTDQQPFIELAQKAHKLRQRRLERNRRFQDVVRTEFSMNSWPSRLNQWWTLEYPEFVGAIKGHLTLSQKDELLELFNRTRPELQDIGILTTRNDQRVDQEFYRLYGLTEAEIDTVEESMGRLW